MSNLLVETLSKALLPGIAIVAVLLVAKRRKLSLRDDIGLRAPRLWFAVVFLLAWLGLIALEEYVTSGMSGTEIKVWPSYPPLILVLRILAIGFLGPVVEELVFRGLLMRVLSNTRVGMAGAILITAALWSAIHVQYAPILLAIIFVDGITLGLARHFAKSLYVPIAMHVLGNLLSIYQSLHP